MFGQDKGRVIVVDALPLVVGVMSVVTMAFAGLYAGFPAVPGIVGAVLASDGRFSQFKGFAFFAMAASLSWQAAWWMF